MMPDQELADLVSRLEEIRDAGGQLVVRDGEFADLVHLGLVTTSLHGSSWSNEVVAELTNKGRRRINMAVLTPPLKRTLGQRLRALLGKFGVALGSPRPWR